jgi:hypothetical protein
MAHASFHRLIAWIGRFIVLLGVTVLLLVSLAKQRSALR